MAMQTTPACRALVWSLIGVGILGGAADVWWDIWWLDEVLHFYNPFAFTLLLTLLIYRLVLTGAHQYRLLFVLTVGSLGLAGGVLWEIGEWAYDHTQQANVILGKTDTMIDLILDLGGGLLAGGVSLIMLDKPSEFKPRRRSRRLPRRTKQPIQSHH